MVMNEYGLLILPIGLYLAMGFLTVGTIREMYITDNRNWFIKFTPTIRFICLFIWPIIIIVLIIVVIVLIIYTIITSFCAILKETFLD